MGNQPHLLGRESYMGRKIEVTQFTAEEFEQWVATTPRPEFKKESKTKAFKTFEERKTNTAGIIRVRVLKDLEDPEKFEFEFERRPGVKAPQESVTKPPAKKQSDINRPTTLLIADARAKLMSELDKAAVILKDVFDPGYKAILKLASEIEGSDLRDVTQMIGIRNSLMSIFIDIGWNHEDEDPVTLAKEDAFVRLDLALGILILVTRLRPFFDRDELQMLSNRILRTKTPLQKNLQQRQTPTA